MGARSKDVAGDLRAAQAALADDDDAAGALGLLLGAWRAVPDLALGDAIEVVGARAAHDIHLPQGVSVEDRDAAWLAAARDGDPVVRHALIAAISDTPAIETHVERCRALVGFRDPRVGKKLLAMLAEQRWPNLRVATFWLPMYTLLVDCGDPRVRAGFGQINWYPRLGRVSNRLQATFGARIAKVQARLETAYPDGTPTLPPAELAIVAAIAARAALPIAGTAGHTATERALLAAVYAAPAEDGPRAIYADFLQERGDPRGEFIALQLRADWQSPAWRDGPAAQRIAHLLAQHRARWLGPLASCLAASKFARGFLDGGALQKGYQAPAPPSDPMWTTVTAIAGGIPATDRDPMPVLASAQQLDAAALISLAKLASPPPLASLGWRSPSPDWNPVNGYAQKTRVAIEAFARVLPRLPALRYLTLEGLGWEAMTPAQLVWPWRGTSIRTLRITATVAMLGPWLAAAAGSTLDELELFGDSAAWRINLVRDRNGVLGKLALKGGFRRDRFPAELETICAAIEVVPPGELTELELATPKEAWTQVHRRRMARALAMHPRLVTRITHYTPPNR